MAKSNFSIHSFLKSKVNSNKRREYEFDRSLYNNSSDLFKQVQQKNNAEDRDLEGEADSNASNYEEKLKLLERNQNNKLSSLSNASKEEMRNLNKQITQNKNENSELSDNLKQAIQELANRRQEEQSAQENPTATTEAQTTDNDENDESFNLDVFDTAEPATVEPATVEPEAASTTSTGIPGAIDKVVKQLVKINDTIDVGNYTYRFTNLFGPRSGANAVKGRSAGEHSRGVDVVGYTKDGKKSNVPIAIADGVILGVSLQGNGKAIKPTEGRAAGYYMDVKMDDGKVVKYMHLGKDAYKNSVNLVGKRIKRGDLLYEGDYSVGSGSQSSPHTKISITSVDKNGKQLLDYTAPENDPTKYILHGKYVEYE
jgi:hypothetical protein